MLRFLEVELQASDTFLKLAISSSYHPGRDYVGLAREAYFAVDRFSERIPMSLAERNRLKEKLSVVKMELAKFGAFFEKPVEPGSAKAVITVEETRSRSKINVSERVAEFLESCEGARVLAERMVAVNREMMETRPPKQGGPVTILRVP